MFDADGGGTISTDEMINTIEALGMTEKLSQVMAKFNHVDADKIDFGAFLKAFGFHEGYEYKDIAKGETDPQLIECREIFEEFDSSNKGAFGAVELQAMAQYVGEDFTDKEIDDMIEAADILDRDGKVGFEEFQRIFSGNYQKKANTKK